MGRVIEQRLPVRGAKTAVTATTTRPPPFQTLVRRAYSWDLSGQVVGIDDQLSGGIRYRFDPGERLVDVLRERGPSEAFEYDAAGNLTRLARHAPDGGDDEGLTYGPGNRLLSRGETRYEYDAQGRLARKIDHADSPAARTWTYEWDSLDQLRSVTRPDGITWKYLYDPFGRRIRKTSAHQRVDFVYSGPVPVHERRTHDEGWTGWVFAPGEHVPLAKVKGGFVYPVITDHLGTPHEMVDSDGRLNWVHRGAAFGASALPGTGDAASCPFRFQGQYEDEESGLCYNRFRYYDPDCGRFISPDPLGAFGALNLYRYAPNPISWIDPLGLQCRGNAATQKHMDDVRDQFLAENPGFVLTAGGRDPITNAQRRETWVPPPGGGVTGGKRPDMTFTNPTTGQVVHVQTVDPRASAPHGMTPRELTNAQTINARTGDTVVTVNKGATPAPGSLNTSTMTPGTLNVI
jgi:RHS repeat-associated protein